MFLKMPPEAVPQKALSPISSPPEGFLVKKCFIVVGSVLMQCLLLGALFYGSFHIVYSPALQHRVWVSELS